MDDVTARARHPGGDPARLGQTQRRATLLDRRPVLIHATGARDRPREGAVPQTTTVNRAGLRSHQTQPEVRPFPPKRQAGRAHRVAINHDESQPDQAPPSRGRCSQGLNRPPAGSHRLSHRANHQRRPHEPPPRPPLEASRDGHRVLPLRRTAGVRRFHTRSWRAGHGGTSASTLHDFRNGLTRGIRSVSLALTLGGTFSGSSSRPVCGDLRSHRKPTRQEPSHGSFRDSTRYGAAVRVAG